MNKKAIVLLAAGILTLGQSAMAAKKTAAASSSKLATAHDSASYALGVQVGSSLKGQLSSLPCEDLNYDIFLEAVNQCLKSADTTKMLIKPSQTPVIINEHMQKAQEEKNLKDKARNDAYMAKNAAEPGVITTKSGLQYMILEDGKSTERPSMTDKVKVNYTGKLINGQTFDSTDGRGPAEFELNKVIKGWTEGIQLMTIGSKYRFFIPSELGYGSRPMATIPANSILIFDVELLDIGKPTPQQQMPQAKFQFKSYEK